MTKIDRFSFCYVIIFALCVRDTLKHDFLKCLHDMFYTNKLLNNQ